MIEFYKTRHTSTEILANKDRNNVNKLVIGFYLNTSLRKDQKETTHHRQNRQGKTIGRNGKNQQIMESVEMHL